MLFKCYFPDFFMVLRTVLESMVFGLPNLHHHVVPLEWISLTLSCHFSLSFIASGRSSGLHPVSSHSYCMYVRAGCPALARPYVGVHRSTSLMSSSLLLQQCPACLACLTWIVFIIGGRWPYSWCFVGCGRQDLFNTARNVLATHTLFLEPSGYCVVIKCTFNFRTTNVFGCFCSIMAQFELIKHKSLN